MEDCKLSLISHPAHIRQSSFDVLKCVAAFLVVAIHYGPYWINPISRIAVPLFFMITGYYFVTFSAISKFRKHFRKILIMTISASLFYGFLSFSSAISFGTFDNWFDSKFNLKTIAVYTLFDLDLFKTKDIKRFEIAYQSEGKYGMKLMLYKREADNGKYDMAICNEGKAICRAAVMWH